MTRSLLRSVFRSALVAVSLAASAALLLPACKSGQGSDSLPKCSFAEWSNEITLAAGASIGGQCMDRAPDVDKDERPNCIVLEGWSGGACDCAAPGLQSVAQAHQGAVDEARNSSAGAGLTCFCELVPLAGAEADACRTSLDAEPAVNGAPVQGYCYLDPAAGLGSAKLVEKCPQNQQHLLRFVGDQAKPKGQTFFSYCGATVCGATDGAGGAQ
jgi:hypothetical protein